MPPLPPGPHAAEILQGLWETSLEPAELSRRSLALTTLSAKLTATSLDGQVGAAQLLNYGQGALADAIAATWTQHFVKLGIAGVQVGEAGACLQEWATILGAMLMKMADTVARAESIIGLLEGARPILEFFQIDVDAEIESIKSQAKAEVVATSAAASSAVSGAGVPAWANQAMSATAKPAVPGATIPDGTKGIEAPGAVADQTLPSSTNGASSPLSTQGIDAPGAVADQTLPSSTNGASSPLSTQGI
ncbi:MAG: hypothetical protein O3A42_17175, partial [Actinobacteria bacterium]|nr:hypothetical protein [Actinomycetota bacterium]